ncbi:MAG: glycosyltransferase family 4 protein [Verrucomicrobia bacterium]|nr:glycosyltransferase family 4 protein [Verrucomicrobiota bacterium]
MKLTILNVAFPFAPVGPDAVGGAEQILTQLDVALAQRGHHSIVVACEGSQTAGQLIGIPRVTGAIHDRFRCRVHAHVRAAIQHALTRWAIDVIHFHGVDCHAYLPAEEIPTLVTLHCPVSFYQPMLFEAWRPQFFIHCVSASQRRSCPPGVHILPDLPNGVPESLLQTRHAKRRFAVALGRICPEKNFHVAIDAAKQANLGLLLAGATFPYPAHEHYYKNEILPRLDRHRLHIGPIGFVRKKRLLSAARCLLMPSLAAETSSLVSMEALACGTPVIAFPSGALPEMIEHGKTGFIVRNQDEMAEAIHAAGSIDPEQCRAAVRSRFCADRMVADYLNLYRRLKGDAPPCLS